MSTHEVDSLSDGRCLPVSRHGVTTGRSEPTVAGRHANDRCVPNISLETTDDASRAESPSLWDPYFVHCHRNPSYK